MLCIDSFGGIIMTEKISRRVVLCGGLRIPVAGALFVALGACGQKSETTSAATGGGASGGTVCADLNSMSDAEQSTRKSLNYVEAGPNPDQVCAKCSFFHPGAAVGGCGTCDMFSGGPVNSHGHCNSWSAKG
jgi:High potential iron-sulfur protein